jgi:hypothetical protein
MLWAWGLHNLTTTSTTLSCSAITSMTRQHCRQHDSASTSCRGHVTSAALLLELLNSIIASMTRHLQRTIARSPQEPHRQHDSVALSPTYLGIYIAPRPSHFGSTVASKTRQQCHQHDFASTSHCGQVTLAPFSPASTSHCGQVAFTPSRAWLNNIAASMTRHLNRATAKSPWHHSHQHDSAAPSLAWLSIYIAPR